MRDDSAAAFLEGLGFGFVIATIVAIGGCSTAGLQNPVIIRQEAVNAGVAEWTIDKDGTKGFKWLSPGKEAVNAGK
ncbi:MAG: hypothetical protein E6Q97_39520 [Desulfurellales bacterium]|nr:MAG: hypothetical protein E6Q97_39520 [Desulfurellales bacterium]